MAIGKSPCFQFYAAEYLADENVALMTLEEEGAYIRALAYCWREGSIPADPARLSLLLKGASNQTVRVVQERFNQHPTMIDRLVHQRLEQEREKQRAWREKSAEGGKKSGKVRSINSLQNEPPFKNGSTTLEPPNEGRSNISFASSSSFASRVT
jgi:uncharacterized protein YdaU (DUF1376 family)